MEIRVAHIQAMNIMHVTFDCSHITIMCKCIVGVSKTGYRPKLDDYLSSVDTPLAQDLLSLTNVSKY